MHCVAGSFWCSLYVSEEERHVCPAIFRRRVGGYAGSVHARMTVLVEHQRKDRACGRLKSGISTMMLQYISMLS